MDAARFSFFGLGSGQSDAYSQNDNPINPYSQFSDGSETVYKARNPDEVDRRKKALTAALTRFENTPEYIKTKQAQALKGNLLQAGGSMKQDMRLGRLRRKPKLYSQIDWRSYMPLHSKEAIAL